MSWQLVWIADKLLHVDTDCYIRYTELLWEAFEMLFAFANLLLTFYF